MVKNATKTKRCIIKNKYVVTRVSQLICLKELFSCLENKTLIPPWKSKLNP